VRKRQFEFKPEYQQASIGNHLAADLNKIVAFWGFSEQVEILSRPDGETFQIRIFRLDPEGKILYEGTERKGFEFINIEIKYPDKFSFSTGSGNEKRSLDFKSSKELEKRSQALLEDALFICWSVLDS
jgi:hypothetical protein